MKTYPDKHIAELIWGKRKKFNPDVKIIECLGGWLVGTPEQLADKALAEVIPSYKAKLSPAQKYAANTKKSVFPGTHVEVKNVPFPGGKKLKHEVTHSHELTDYMVKLKGAAASACPGMAIAIDKDLSEQLYLVQLHDKKGHAQILQLSYEDVEKISTAKLAKIIAAYMANFPWEMKKGQTKVNKLNCWSAGNEKENEILAEKAKATKPWKKSPTPGTNSFVGKILAAASQAFPGVVSTVEYQSMQKSFLVTVLTPSGEMCMELSDDYVIDAPQEVLAKDLKDLVAQGLKKKEGYVDCEIIDENLEFLNNSMPTPMSPDIGTVHIHGVPCSTGPVFNYAMLKNVGGKIVGDHFYFSKTVVKFAAPLYSNGAVYFGLLTDGKTPQYISKSKLYYWQVVEDEAKDKWLIALAPVSVLKKNKMLSVIPSDSVKPKSFVPWGKSVAQSAKDAFTTFELPEDKDVKMKFLDFEKPGYHQYTKIEHKFVHKTTGTVLPFEGLIETLGPEYSTIEVVVPEVAWHEITKLSVNSGAGLNEVMVIEHHANGTIIAAKKDMMVVEVSQLPYGTNVKLKLKTL